MTKNRDIKHIQLILPAETHRLARIAAAIEGVPFTRFTEEAVRAATVRVLKRGLPADVPKRRGT